MFIEANLGNPGLYPGTVELADRVIAAAGSLLHGKGLPGLMVEGATEGNIVALWAARNSLRRKKVLYGKTAHFSVRKACDLLGLEGVEIPFDAGYRMDVGAVKEQLDGSVAAVVGVAGTTELGVVDPIPELARLCRGEFVLHVDGALGGFLLPFLPDRAFPPFDFRNPGVSSIVLDGHKMGMAAIPSSMLLFRDPKFIESIAVESPYLTSPYQTSLLGTRCSAGVAGTYAAFRTLGKEGYRKLARDVLEKTQWLARACRESGLNPVIDPPLNVLALQMKRPQAVLDEMRRKGWWLSTARYPPSLRIVVMPHATKTSLRGLMKDLSIVTGKMGER